MTSLDYKKFYELSTNIYITMAGSKELWEFMYNFIASEVTENSKFLFVLLGKSVCVCACVLIFNLMVTVFKKI